MTETQASQDSDHLQHDHPAEGYSGVHDRRHGDRSRSYYFAISPECAALRVAIKSILIHAHQHEWTVQGFGMMRTYLPFGPNPKRFRLNVWNAAMAVPHVSTMHDHPWSFQSWIINGNFRNTRFLEDQYNGDDWSYSTIMCGIMGDNATRAQSRIRLRALPTEHYRTGDTYKQDASEIHVSEYDDGTVTLNDRVGDTEHARVFWPAGLEWVDAKPRAATEMEIATARALALNGWQDEIAR